eukprot:jgi/Bigna1/66265/fgenesh1_pg.1_\
MASVGSTKPADSRVSADRSQDLPALGDLRKKIDECDRAIIKLLNDRMKVCQMIGQAKGRMMAMESKEALSKEEEKKQVYRPAREKLVFDKVMSCSINLQQPTTIGYLGPPASSSHVAAVNRFGASMAFRAISSTADILSLVENGAISYGVIPIGNSHAGLESNTLDELANTQMKIYAEIEIPLSFALLSYVKSKTEIATVYGSQALLLQCKKWLTINVPEARLVVCSSTEDACKRVKEARAGGDAEKKGSAAVGTLLASDITGIPIIDEHMEDRASTSRFFVISQVCEPPSGEDKTFVIFSLKDTQGALFRALKIMKEEEINLTNIESRPSGSKAWDYNFFVRMDGHEQDKGIAAALNRLRKVCSYVRVLGSYPENKASCIDEVCTMVMFGAFEEGSEFLSRILLAYTYECGICRLTLDEFR